MIAGAVSRVLIYSNVFVALVLAILTWSSYASLSMLDMKWYVPASVFLGSFVLYTFHRLYKIDFIPEDQLSSRHLWVVRRSNAMKYANGQPPVIRIGYETHGSAHLFWVEDNGCGVADSGLITSWG